MICSTCGKEKSKELFSKNNITKDGNRGLCKKCKSLFNKKYREKNKEKIAKYAAKKWRENPEIRKKNKLYKELQRTGMNASEFVKDKCCEICGITNKEHKLKYNERLHIHHKNNNGRKNIRIGIKPNHDDLQILCRSCHVSEDNKNRDYTNRGKKIWETRRKNQSK